MARRLRIEFEGAIYHVLNRGNYRRDLFTNPGEAGAFVGALREAVETFGWKLYAYAIMRNHYHLAIQTAQPNLKAGMHWLQSTFATRFNRLHGERGHLFQGRYQSLLVENDAALARLVNYIHLNPVRAGIVAPAQAASFRWSSLRGFVRNERFKGLEAADWLRAMGLADDAEAWAIYVERLHQLSLSPTEQDRLGFAGMSRGWAIGSDSWRKAVARDHAALAFTPGLVAHEVRELAEVRWTAALEQHLATERRTEEDCAREPKSAAWKIALAASLRQESGASIVWLARRLHMGKPESVRSYLSRYARQNSAR